MTKRAWELFAGLCLLTFVSIPARADRSSDICVTYYAPNSTIPREASDYLTRFKGAAIRICTSPRRTAKRFVLLPSVRRGQLGVCYTWSVEMFPVRSAKGEIIWRDKPLDRETELLGSYPSAQLYMSVPAHDCPIQGDEQYVAVRGISEGVFRGVMAAWREIAKNGERLDTALASLPSSKRSGVDFEGLKNAIQNRASGRSAPFDSIVLREAPMNLSGPSRYEIRIDDPIKLSRTYRLDIDIIGTNLHVFQYNVYTD